MQRNWIGRSRGRGIDFPIDGRDAAISVFTTRPDTLFGATYMVLSPEHPLVDADRHAPSSARRLPTYRAEAARARSTRRAWPRPRPACSPAPTPSTRSNGERIPIWIADYVLMGYGTGAIMAVPAHDQRDFDFAVALGFRSARS